LAFDFSSVRSLEDNYKTSKPKKSFFNPNSAITIENSKLFSLNTNQAKTYNLTDSENSTNLTFLNTDTGLELIGKNLTDADTYSEFTDTEFSDGFLNSTTEEVNFLTNNSAAFSYKYIFLNLDF